MPRFNVNVRFSQNKIISVYARDEEEAQEKAVEVVTKWSGVDEVDAIECEMDN